MTACQKIKRDILLLAVQDLPPIFSRSGAEDELFKSVSAGITDETVDAQYGALIELDRHWDYETDFRGGTVETKLPCGYSRDYEAKSVGRKLSDGSWVGWTYWYGGGKYGDPASIKWMQDAYDLEVTETQKLVTIQEFKKI